MKCYNILLGLCFFIFSLKANIINIPADAPTIQAGIDSAAIGDTVLVSQGIYLEGINNNGKNIIIGSRFLTTGDTTYIDSTIIDGNNTTRPVTILGSVDSTMIFTGFTVQNGSVGGIGCGQGASPIISNNIVRNNHGNSNNAGIACTNGNPIIRYNKIVGNINGSSISDNGGGIACYFSGNPIIYKNIIENNNANKGGGIYCFVPGDTAIIRDNIIDGNISENGSGIYCLSSFAIITGNMIRVNKSNINGGGIYCDDASPVIKYNTISSDSAGIGGGGIYCGNNSNPEIRYNLICDNEVLIYGGAIYSQNSLPLIENNTICGNFSTIPGGGSAMYIENSQPIISNNIFANNTGGPAVVTGAALNYCAFYNNTGGHFSATPPGTGVITITNNNGDSCDVYFNIFIDPLFADTAYTNFHLTENSPCIDAGDPSSPYDPDNTITDMGRYFFNQGPVISISDSLLDFGEVLIGQQSDLALIIRNVGFSTLRLNSIVNQQPEFTCDWNPADSLILAGDSLTITVTFTPVNTNLIVDTLLIGNNDKPLQIQLLGKGKTVDGIEDQNERPKVYALYPAYPNPFNPSTTIEFDLPQNSFVLLKVYNILGEEVSTLIARQMSPGRYKNIWQVDDLASGIYFYRLTANEFVKVRKILLLR